ncbi:MAG: FAD-binding protein [Myxococcota bacterium]
MQTKYDVVIVGAGPAGATLARLLSPRYSVLLADSREVTDSKQAKVCGGLLAPDAQRALAALGLGLPLDILVGPQLFAVRALDLLQGHMRFYQRHYVNIDRGAFDRWLVSLVPPQVEVCAGLRFRSARRDEGRWAVRFLRGDRIEEVQAELIVGADGAASSVRRKLSPKAVKAKRYVALQERFSASDSEPFFSAFFDPRLTDFYGWMIPKGDQILLGAALPERADAAARFERFKDSLALRGVQIGEPLVREAALILRPGPRRSPFLAADGVALIGEAAGLISPSSAEGISYAFCSAVALAEALSPGLNSFSGRYRRALAGVLLKIMLKSAKAPFIFTPWMRGAVMRAGISRVEPAPKRGPMSPSGAAMQKADPKSLT